MSELIDAGRNRSAIRWHLLTTVSMLALLPWAASQAKAGDDADRPTIWIELGGQLERQTGQGDLYDPPIVANNLSSPAFKPISPLQSEKPPIFSNGGQAKLSFQPEESDWVFSASVRYGRANGRKSAYQNGPGQHFTAVYRTYERTSSGYVFKCCHTRQITHTRVGYADTKVAHRDSHTILDFQAGKEVGLGMFGRTSESVLGAGVRFAQFAAKSSISIHAKPDASYHNYYAVYYPNRLITFPQLYAPLASFHVASGAAQSMRSFHGLGPAISWESSIALLGNAQAGEFSFDWGANAAVLFGRRKAAGKHHESGHFVPGFYRLSYYTHTASFDRKKSVTVPNVGGFAGVSFKFPNAKVSLGYRGDFFFGAMDTGIDTEKTKAVGFYGPFANVSIGIGG